MPRKFDPPEDLTPNEVTKILRELYQYVPDEQFEQMQRDTPILASYMIEIQPGEMT